MSYRAYGCFEELIPAELVRQVVPHEFDKLIEVISDRDWDEVSRDLYNDDCGDEDILEAANELYRAFRDKTDAGISVFWVESEAEIDIPDGKYFAVYDYMIPKPSFQELYPSVFVTTWVTYG